MLSQGLLDVGWCCGISATLRGGVTCVTFMQAKSVVMHKITLSSKLLHFTNFFQTLSYIFPSLNFTPHVWWIFLLFLPQQLVDRYGYSSIAIGILTFI